MSIDELKTLTAEFDDIKELITKRNIAAKNLIATRRRLRSALLRYRFLMDMVGITVKGDQLVVAIKNYFKYLEVKAEIVPEKFGEEDLRIWYDDKLILVEITGTDGKFNRENKSHQISKHIPLKQSKFSDYKVTGLFISNHDNRTPFHSKNPKAFEKRIGEIAKSHNYTVTTTNDLLKAFMRIKNRTLTVPALMQMIYSSGELRI